MNLTIHERHGGGFCVTLAASGIGYLLSPLGEPCWDEALAESDTLTLTLEQGEPVTFTSFSSLARVLHGDLRLRIKETSS